MADPANSEEVSVQFIAEEIELGLAFATLAATEYAQGRVDRAREVRAKGEKAGAQAERRLQEAQERGWMSAFFANGYAISASEWTKSKARQRPRDPMSWM